MILHISRHDPYESIRDWVNKFSLPTAKKIRKRRRKASDKWHLDEVRVKIREQIYWLWRAVDDEGKEDGKVQTSPKISVSRRVDLPTDSTTET